MTDAPDRILINRLRDEAFNPRNNLAVQVECIRAADAIADLQAENRRLRHIALKAYTVVEWVAGDGFVLEMPHEDADDLMLEMARVLGVETSIEARAALRGTETSHDPH